MIPKIIHYCWFGNSEIPKSVKKCIKSWEKFCPDYKIIRWDESNFDINIHPYMKEAYDAKKWPFVSDLARLLIVYNSGGIYLDTDVELITGIDRILDNTFFLAIEKTTNIRNGSIYTNVATGLGFGAEEKNEIIKSMIEEYDNQRFILSDGNYDLTPCPKRNTNAIRKFGWDGNDRVFKFNGGTLYSSEYFCPVEFSSDITHFTNNTLSIHHYDASWKSRKEKMIDKMKLNVKKMIRAVRPKPKK